MLRVQTRGKFWPFGGFCLGYELEKDRKQAIFFFFIYNPNKKQVGQNFYETIHAGGIIKHNRNVNRGKNDFQRHVPTWPRDTETNFNDDNTVRSYPT